MTTGQAVSASTTPDHPTPDRPTTRAVGGWCLVAAGVTGAASAVYLAFVAPSVSPEVFSYPLATGPFTAIQVFFAVHHLALAVGLFAVWRSGLAGAGRLAAVGGLAATASMVLFAGQELVAITAAEAPYPSPQTDAVEGVYGMLSLLCGVTLILFGVPALRARRWQGWRRAWLLALGGYVLVPLTPAVFGPFVVARLAIGVWMLMFVGLGVALLRPRARPGAARRVSGVRS